MHMVFIIKDGFVLHEDVYDICDMEFYMKDALDFMHEFYIHKKTWKIVRLFKHH